MRMGAEPSARRATQRPRGWFGGVEWEEAGRVDERERSRTRGPQIARWAVRCARPGLEEEEEKKVSLRA